MKFRVTIIVAAVACLLPCSTMAAQATARIPFRLSRRTLDASLDYGAGSLRGASRMRLVNISKRPARIVPLLLNRLMTVSGVTGTSGGPLQFRQAFKLFEDDSTLQVNAVEVSLPRTLAPGDSQDVVVSFGGHLVGYEETGSLYIHDKVDSAFTIIRQDAFAFPVVGVPSRRENREAGYEPFQFDARITVPKGFVVATGGHQLESTVTDSLVTWRYQTTEPSPFMNIAIAPYRVMQRGGTRVFFFGADSAGAVMVDIATAGALALFTELFGPLEREPSLSVIEIPVGWGSQASVVGGIDVDAEAFRDRAQLYQLYHELSHLWNVTDRDVPSPRWNEGLAMFLMWRAAEKLDSWSDWDARIDRAERSIKRDCAAPTSCATVPLADYGRHEMTGLSYSAGMAMFYALYKTLGAESFDRAYRAFFQQHRATGGTTADLIAAFHNENAASDRIFAEWYSSTVWYRRVNAGETVRAIVNSYPHRAPPPAN